jgi:hypothetical protein
MRECEAISSLPNPAKICSQIKLFSITKEKYVKRNSTAQHLWIPRRKWPACSS